jgi:hypothetical protein
METKLKYIRNTATPSDIETFVGPLESLDKLSDRDINQIYWRLRFDQRKEMREEVQEGGSDNQVIEDYITARRNYNNFRMQLDQELRNSFDASVRAADVMLRTGRQYNEEFLINLTNQIDRLLIMYGPYLQEDSTQNGGNDRKAEIKRDFEAYLQIYNSFRNNIPARQRSGYDGGIRAMQLMLNGTIPYFEDQADEILQTLIEVIDHYGELKEEVQEGGGDRGLDNVELKELMGDKDPAFRGVFAVDTLKNFQPFRCGKRCTVSMIINTEDFPQSGHWVAIRIDDVNDVIEYYDPFGRPPSKEMKHQIKRLVDGLKRSMGFAGKFQFKINRIQAQDTTTNNCGFFAARFLIERAKGKTWKDSTMWDELMSRMDGAGEKEIKRFKKVNGDFGVI